jgi:hypothetical protein
MKEGMALLIRRCVETGAFPPSVEPRAAFRVLGAALTGAAIVGLGHRLAPGEDPDRLAHDVIDLMIAGLRSDVPMRFVAGAQPCFFQGESEAAEAATLPRDSDSVPEA